MCAASRLIERLAARASPSCGSIAGIFSKLFQFFYCLFVSNLLNLGGRFYFTPAVGNVLQFDSAKARLRPEQCASTQAYAERQRQIAADLISQASSMLLALGPNEQRVAWMVQDCLDLLDSKESKTPDTYSLQALL